MDAQRYDELHGSNNWAGLLDPLDLDLRNLLIGYGDLSSAAERAFNNDAGSLYNGYCYYGKSSFFKGVMLPLVDSKYQVTSFIYATAQANSITSSRDDSEFESNWMGYVAVSSDEHSKVIGRREVCVVWRGTARTYEWIDDIAGAEPVPAEPLLPSTNSTGELIKDPTGLVQTLYFVKLLPIMGTSLNHLISLSILITAANTDTPHIMGGWLTIYTTSDPNSEFIPSSARTQLLERIKELLEKYKEEKVSITCSGHSLGACLAVLSAFDLARNVVTPDINVSAFIFASPQVGNQSFKEKIEELPNLKVLRVKNDPDIIPFWPSKILKWVSDNVWESVPSELQEYVDVGVDILIDSKKSPYLKEESKLNDLVHPLVYHNLQGTLHTLSGWNGKNGDFDWNLVKRSLGWVNMSNDILKEEFKIPTSWWVEKNKGMMLDDNGDWVLSPIDRADHDLPV